MNEKIVTYLGTDEIEKSLDINFSEIEKDFVDIQLKYEGNIDKGGLWEIFSNGEQLDEKELAIGSEANLTIRRSFAGSIKKPNKFTVKVKKEYKTVAQFDLKIYDKPTIKNVIWTDASGNKITNAKVSDVMNLKIEGSGFYRTELIIQVFRKYEDKDQEVLTQHFQVRKLSNSTFFSIDSKNYKNKIVSFIQQEMFKLQKDKELFELYCVISHEGTVLYTATKTLSVQATLSMLSEQPERPTNNTPAVVTTEDFYEQESSEQESSDTIKTDFYVKVRHTIGYKGEFGFDWIDVDPIATADEKVKVTHVQGTSVANLEYYFTNNNFKRKENDYDSEFSSYLIEQYGNLIEHCENGTIDMPYILIKPGKSADLILTIKVPNGKLENQYIILKNNINYNFEIETKGAENNVEGAKILVSKDMDLKLKIKCLKEHTGEQIHYITENNKKFSVGGFKLMENKVLTLPFRVIAFVGKEDDYVEKAKVLFNNFKEKGVIKYLQDNSLNQAGYEIIIENQAFIEKQNLSFNENDPLSDMGNQKLSSDIEKKIEFDSFCYQASDDWYDTGSKIILDGKRGKKIMNENIVDKLIESEYSKEADYSGPLIILSDFLTIKDGMKGFSRSDPLGHKVIVVLSEGIKMPRTYAHEIGHMLGLEHYFYDCRSELELIKTYYDELNISLNQKKSYLKRRKNTKRKVPISEFTTTIDNYNKLIKSDIENRDDVTKIVSKDYIVIKIKGDFVVDIKTYIILIQDTLKYTKEIINQYHSNNIKGIKKKTTNFLDYSRANPYNEVVDLRKYYTHQQIKIMREDYNHLSL